MQITIRKKLVFGYLIMVILMTTLTLYAIGVSQKFLKESVGRNSIFLAEEVLKRINYNLQHTIEHIQLHALHLEIRHSIVQSNNTLQELENIETSLHDSEWNSMPQNDEIPLIHAATRNTLSDELHVGFIQYWESTRGYRLFEEVIVTDRYGANVAQTGKTSENNQANEIWWKKTKEQGDYIGDVEYNEGIQTFVIPVGIRINDENNHLIGMMKAAVSVTALIREAEVSTRTYQTSEIQIVSARTQRLLYATRAFHFLEDVSEKGLFEKLQGKQGFFIEREGVRTKLFSYSRATDLGRDAGLDWLLVLSHDEREVLAPLVSLRNNILLIAGLLTAIGLMSVFVISHSITQPISTLITSAGIIGRGDLTHRVAIRTQDEIGELATAFNRMTETRERTEEELRNHREHLEELVKQRTKELQESELFNKKILELSTNGIYIYDLNKGCNIYINHQYTRLLGYTLDAINAFKSEEFFALFYSDDRPRVTAHMEDIIQARDDDIFEIEYQFKTAEGRWIWCLSWDMVFERDDDGNVRQFIGSFIDITERKWAEMELERLNTELSQKNTELEQVVYVTSHDLRSPLVNVQGFSRELKYAVQELSELLQGSDIPPDTSQEVSELIHGEITEDLNYILVSISKMDNLLSGLLKLSRLGRAALTIEALDMNILLEQVVSSFEFHIQEAGVKVEIASLPSCQGDETQINQVFSNLLGNALKYLDPQEPGQIRVWGRTEEGQIVYGVEDNGIGIAPEHQAKIFEIFHRLDPTQKSGEGLGLTIVRKILERHNGRIWVESEAGQGSRFFVSLPKREDWSTGVVE